MPLAHSFGFFPRGDSAACRNSWDVAIQSSKRELLTKKRRVAVFHWSDSGNNRNTDFSYVGHAAVLIPSITVKIGKEERSYPERYFSLYPDIYIPNVNANQDVRTTVPCYDFHQRSCNAFMPVFHSLLQDFGSQESVMKMTKQGETVFYFHSGMLDIAAIHEKIDALLGQEFAGAEITESFCLRRAGEGTDSFFSSILREIYKDVNEQIDRGNCITVQDISRIQGINLEWAILSCAGRERSCLGLCETLLNAGGFDRSLQEMHYSFPKKNILMWLIGFACVSILLAYVVDALVYNDYEPFDKPLEWEFPIGLSCVFTIIVGLINVPLVSLGCMQECTRGDLPSGFARMMHYAYTKQKMLLQDTSRQELSETRLAEV